MITQLENMSNEIFLEIFEYLNGNDILLWHLLHLIHVFH